MSNNTKEISRACKSKYNNECENQVILLTIKDGKRSDGVEKSHYLALKSEPVLYNGKLCNRPVKSLSRLLKEKSFFFLLFELFQFIQHRK